MNTNSNSYTIIYASIMVVVVCHSWLVISFFFTFFERNTV